MFLLRTILYASFLVNWQVFPAHLTEILQISKHPVLFFQGAVGRARLLLFHLRRGVQEVEDVGALLVRRLSAAPPQASWNPADKEFELPTAHQLNQPATPTTWTCNLRVFLPSSFPCAACPPPPAPGAAAAPPMTPATPTRTSASCREGGLTDE